MPAPPKRAGWPRLAGARCSLGRAPALRRSLWSASWPRAERACLPHRRIWVTQPCAVCNKDDNEELLLLCGTDDADAPVQGCERSHHTYCVGIEEVPEEDWFCSKCAAAS